jgi:hypothetical protein
MHVLHPPVTFIFRRIYFLRPLIVKYHQHYHQFQGIGLQACTGSNDFQPISRSSHVLYQISSIYILPSEYANRPHYPDYENMNRHRTFLHWTSVLWNFMVEGRMVRKREMRIWQDMNTKSPWQVLSYGKVRTKVKNSEWIWRRNRIEKRARQMAAERRMALSAYPFSFSGLC